MRNLHIVIPSIGRARCSPVAAEALARESRLARLTIVTQIGTGVVDDRLADGGHGLSLRGTTAGPPPTARSASGASSTSDPARLRYATGREPDG